MSVRAVAGRIFKHGTILLRNQYKANTYRTTRNISFSIKSANQALPNTQKSPPITNYNNRNVLRNICRQINQHARRILIDNAINRFSFKIGTEFFQKAKERGLYGNTAPLLSLVGVAVASGSQGILSKDDELEGICWEIRECITKIQQTRDIISHNFTEEDVMNLKALSFGKPIAKGSNAVVYSVKQYSEVSNTSEDSDIEIYPLALKMMFNYDIQSNSIAILKAMYREIVPAASFFNNQGINHFEYEFLKTTRYLPPHPNIVQIFSVFSDFIPELEKCRDLYPAALPKRIYESGEGRNMSLFILMKRYHQNLHEYLKQTKISIRSSAFMFTQLLEGIVHMVTHNVAHRDLKADNLLLDLSNPNSPVLVITDFGCCLAESATDLTVPYTTNDVDKGGNTALMAPEIINKKPGVFTKLNYSKSDLWAAGSIAYEIFGCINPFYGDKTKRLSSLSYRDEDLPNLPVNVPLILKRLVKNILQKDPSKRLDPEVAANIAQLYLWAPNSWLNTDSKIPKCEEILEWLLNLAVKLFCEFRCDPVNDDDINKNNGYISFSEYLLISTFLCRAKLLNIKTALEWIQNNSL
ncbi:PTEN-induced putative kinase 1 [Rhynchophorus ferrugineus]|uniref:PTEN-induced putative kinase 1 n=1 Tax=Rhynchophorus ferrugineus TaxID=354439 RepID=UPI003FCDF827